MNSGFELNVLTTASSTFTARNSDFYPTRNESGTGIHRSLNPNPNPNPIPLYPYTPIPKGHLQGKASFPWCLTRQALKAHLGVRVRVRVRPSTRSLGRCRG